MASEGKGERTSKREMHGHRMVVYTHIRDENGMAASVTMARRHARDYGTTDDDVHLRSTNSEP